MRSSIIYLDWKRSSRWLESWERLLFVNDVSTTCAEAIFRVNNLIYTKCFFGERDLIWRDPHNDEMMNHPALPTRSPQETRLFRSIGNRLTHSFDHSNGWWWRHLHLLNPGRISSRFLFYFLMLHAQLTPQLMKPQQLVKLKAFETSCLNEPFDNKRFRVFCWKPKPFTIQ